MAAMLKLLRPGLHVKRWFGVLLLGMVVISLGIGFALAAKLALFRLHRRFFASPSLFERPFPPAPALPAGEGERRGGDRAHDEIAVLVPPSLELGDLFLFLEI